MWKVEFEARAPDEDDFHGIKLLVKQLFLRSAAVNVSKVTETILNQRYIGSVIKTVQPDEDEEDDVADDDHIYAISTVLNLAEKNKWVLPKLIQSKLTWIFHKFVQWIALLL